MRINRLKLLLVGNQRDHLEPLKSLIFDTLPDEPHVRFALNAEQGMAIAQCENPDLIILDVALPEMQSFTICQKLKADQGLKSIPVVFLTSPETDQTSLAKAFDAGADAFLSFPLDPISFQTQMRAMARLKEANLKEHDAMAAKDFLANIINHMGQPVFVKDEQHRFLLVNDAFCALFDLNREQIIGYTLAEKVPLNEHERITKIDKKVLSDGTMSISEESLTVHEHISMHFLTTKTRYINKNGEKFLIVVVQDITQQKKAEAESHSKDIQFKKLSDNIPDLIFQFTRRPDGTYCVPIASKGIENIFGCTPEDVKEDFTAIAKVLHPEDSARVIDAIEYSAKHLSDFICEFRVNIPGRDIQWILSRSKPEQLSDGSITWFGFNVDITQQKRTEQELQEYQQRLKELVDLKADELQTSERHFRHLVEGVKQDYFFFTIGSEGVLTYLSPSAETFFGQDMDKLLGKSGNELLHLENEGPLYHGDLGMGDPDPPSFEIDLTIQGEKHFLEISEHITRNERGAVIAEEGVIKDITRQKRVEQELREAIESAKIASQAKSMFLANMSHEIRTPMNAILGFSELMQEQAKEPRFQKYLEAINSSGKALLKIINEILDLSKIESGKLALQLESVNLLQIIKELNLLLDRSFEQKGLHFYVEMSADMPVYFELDALRLRQVLLNLLGNALKFTSVGTVSLKLDFVPQNAEQGCLTLAVQDTGLGISEENQKRIFKAFEQVIDSTHPFSSGTGLGLTITQSLVNLMGGELQMSSVVGQGTCFTVVLPDVHLAESLALEANQAPIDMTLFLPAQLLIADDVPENLLLLESILESSPLNVTLAHNGREACEMALAIQPDLILMDIKMPEMDGIQALQQLKSQAETQAIPVVALTAYSLKQDQESLIKKGFDAYLSKPVQKTDLLSCLNTFLPSRERGSECTTAETVISDVQLTAEERAHWQKLCHEQWLPRWQSIKDSMVLNELESFATELQAFAKASPFVELQTFTQRLLVQIGQFDFVMCQKTLRHFPDLLTSIFDDHIPR